MNNTTKNGVKMDLLIIIGGSFLIMLAVPPMMKFVEWMSKSKDGEADDS